MRRNVGCLYLMLVLLSAWTDNLQAGAFLSASPARNPMFGQDVYPLSVRFRAEIQEKLESLPCVSLSLLSAGFPAESPGFVLATVDDVPPQVLSSAERCYLLMSLQE